MKKLRARLAFGITGIISLCLLGVSGAAAEENGSGEPVKTFRKEYTVYFRINRYDIDTTFLGNGETIRRMQHEIDSLLSAGAITADSISIVSAASPDGRNSFNVWLSKKRGLAAHSLLESQYPDIDPSIIFIDPVGEDWDTFRRVVDGDPNIPDREKLRELMDSDLPADEKERRFRQMKQTFRYIVNHHIYLMRASAVTFNISMPLITLAMGKNSIAELSVELRPAVLDETGAVIQEALTWNWGNFLQTIIDFLIIALVVFLMIKLMMGLKKVSEKAQEGARELADKVMGKDEAEEGAADAESAEVAASDAEKIK